MNKTLKSIIAALCLSALMFCTPATATAREKTLGVKLGYAGRNKSPLMGLYFDYRFSNHFALSPNIDYVFRHDGTDAFIFNIDARFPFRVAPRFDVYPLVGIDYASWAYHHDNDSSERLNHLGFNFGAGCDYMCTSSLKLTFQAKYNAIKNVDSAYFWLGIGYVF